MIYLDHNASTPLAPEARAAMLPWLDAGYGNPASDHWAARPAREAIAFARGQVAALIGARPEEIVFTSGGTESNNAAIRGVWAAKGQPGGVVVTSAVEHPATLEPCRELARQGACLLVLPVDGTGRLKPEAAIASLSDNASGSVVLLSVMHAQNEVGTLQPVAELAGGARRVGAVVHTDAAQSAGKVPVDVDELGVDLLSLAGHKLYGPKGVGALYIRRGTPWRPLLLGAGHQEGRRPGTESVLLAAGLGAACEAAARGLGAMVQVATLRDRLWERIRAALGDRVVLLGHPTERLPNTLNIGFRGCVGADILARCPELAASTGSACHSGRAELSATLRAMGAATEEGLGAVRLSLGRGTTEPEIELAAAWLIAAAVAQR